MGRMREVLWLDFDNHNITMKCVGRRREILWLDFDKGRRAVVRSTMAMAEGGEWRMWDVGRRLRSTIVSCYDE